MGRLRSARAGLALVTLLLRLCQTQSGALLDAVEAARLAPDVAAPSDADSGALWRALQAQATNETTRRLQNNFGNLAAAGPGGGPVVGAASNGPIPTALTRGDFVLDLERHVSMSGTGANIGVDDYGNRLKDTKADQYGYPGPTQEVGSGLGIFVDRVGISFDTGYNGSKPDDAALIAQGNGERSIYVNTTVAEVHYKIIGCPGAVLAPDQELCDSKFTIFDEFRPFFYGTADVGNANDRGRGDGILYTTWDNPVTAEVNLEPGLTTRAPDGDDQTGFFQIESFTMLVDVAQIDQFGSPLVIAISPVSYSNVTIIKGVEMPVMDPPQDFFFEALNVTIETATDDAHVFFTLQPPFVYDKNGTWCPHMGVWCSNFPHEPTYHAVPNQPPSFWYSQRGLWTRIFGTPYSMRWNITVDPTFPMGTNLTQMVSDLMDEKYCDTALYGGPVEAGGLTEAQVDECDRLWALEERLLKGQDLIKWDEYLNKLTNVMKSKLPYTPPSLSEALLLLAEMPFGAIVDGGERTTGYPPNAGGAELDVFVDGSIDPKTLEWRPSVGGNLSLYPTYTIEKAPGVWLLFEPVEEEKVEYFHVDVSTCYNRSYPKTTLHSRQMEGTRSVTNNIGVVTIETYPYTEYFNVTINVTEPICEAAMQVPAANPCPWSRDCKLLGEVSFKLRAYALKTDWVDSVTASGLYTFITGGTPQWMNTRDECGGFRQSTMSPFLKYAVADHSVWEILAPYDCPPGYHWASTAEALDLLDYDAAAESIGGVTDPYAPDSGDAADMWSSNVTAHEWQKHQAAEKARDDPRDDGAATELTYADQCGWKGTMWEGKHRQYFRFSDSGPRYLQFEPVSGATWPEEGYFFRGDYVTTTNSHPHDMDVYHTHLTAWYWYQHNENFTLARPYEEIQLYSDPTNATWAMKAADSLDYMGLELWTGDNLGDQPKFAGAVCRTNGDWTPPRVVIKGPLIITIEIHTVYDEMGALAWDPVDDTWFPQWKRCPDPDSGVTPKLGCTSEGMPNWKRGNYSIDDGVVRITGFVNHSKVGVYHMYYDATDLHGNHARQQMRTIIVIDRTIPIITVTTGVHQRVCEPWTDSNCSEPNMPSINTDGQYTNSMPLYPYNGWTTVACPPLHTCDTRSGGFLEPRGNRTNGTHITIEAGTPYVELGATATDNEQDYKTLTNKIVTRYYGPLREDKIARREYPIYPDFYMSNKAWVEFNLAEVAQAMAGGGLNINGAIGTTTEQDVIDMGLVEDGKAYGKQLLQECGYDGYFNFDPADCADPDNPEQYPSCGCGFEWQKEDADGNLIVFNTTFDEVFFQEGFQDPATLTLSQPRSVPTDTDAPEFQPSYIEFDFVNYMLPGVYNVTYDVTDEYNNSAVTVHKTVTVKDTTPPVLHLNGDPIMIVRYNETFVDPGAFATDIGDDYFYNLNRFVEYHYNNTNGTITESGFKGQGSGYQGVPNSYEVDRTEPNVLTRHGGGGAQAISAGGWQGWVYRGEPPSGGGHGDGGGSKVYPAGGGQYPGTLVQDRLTNGWTSAYCNHTQHCTNEGNTSELSDKIITRVRHERLECVSVPVYAERNSTPPICIKTTSEQPTAFITCPNGTAIAGFNFLSLGKPSGECSDKTPENPVPFEKNQYCLLEGAEDGSYRPADEEMFYELCYGKQTCTLESNWAFYGLNRDAVDPCPQQAKWLIVDAVCAHLDPGETIRTDVICDDQQIQIPSLGTSAQPPLLGRLDYSLPGSRPGQYPLRRFDGTWYRLDDFLSRVDPSLATLHEKHSHQDVRGEDTFPRERVGDQWFVNTTLNTTLLGLYIITYDVTDMAGNAATQLSRFVIVQDDSELYQNSIQQVYNGTSGVFTGAVLPHLDNGGTKRVASHVVELSRNRPTRASSIWGVHTPSSAAVNGMYGNHYLEPSSKMDEYGRTLYEYPKVSEMGANIFHSGPAIWFDPNPPLSHQWWMVHLASYTDNPSVKVWTRDCCTEQFDKTLEMWIGVTRRQPEWAGETPGPPSTDPLPVLCGTMQGLEPDTAVEAICEGEGEYFFLAGTAYIHFAEVEVTGFGGGPGRGHDQHSDAAYDMAAGMRHDVGFHEEGAQYAITIPVENVTVSWWVEVPPITVSTPDIEGTWENNVIQAVGGRQLVFELNTTRPNEPRNVRAHVQHAVHGGTVNGSDTWNFTESGERRRKTDGFVYGGETAITKFTVTETPEQHIKGNVEYTMTYAVMPIPGYESDCVCSQDVLEEQGMPCHVQCPPGPNDPRFSYLNATTEHVFVPDLDTLAEDDGEFVYYTYVEAELPLQYWEVYATEWGASWIADTLALEPAAVTDFYASNMHHWIDTNFRPEAVWRAAGISREVFAGEAKYIEPADGVTREHGGVFKENGHGSPWAASTARAQAGYGEDHVAASAGAHSWRVARQRDVASDPRHDNKLESRFETSMGFRKMPAHVQEMTLQEKAAWTLANLTTPYTPPGTPYYGADGRRLQPREPLLLETYPTGGVARKVVSCGPREDDLQEGVYFVTVSAEPIRRMHTQLRYAHTTETDTTETEALFEPEYQAVPYSLRTTFIEPILLPSAVDVVGQVSGVVGDVKTIYYFEVYLNQKISLELMGAEGTVGGVSAILHYAYVGDRDDEVGFLGKGRLQTYKVQSSRPPGYDYLFYCPHELSPGRYYVELRGEQRDESRSDYTIRHSDYTIRLNEYTPYCPNNCTGVYNQGHCDCTILRCICEPGFFGDDCSIAPSVVEIPAALKGTLPVDSVTGEAVNCDETEPPANPPAAFIYSHGSVRSCDCCTPFETQSVVLDHHGGGEDFDMLDQSGRGTLFNLTCPHAICSNGGDAHTRDTCEQTGFKWTPLKNPITGGPSGGYACILDGDPAGVNEFSYPEGKGVVEATDGPLVYVVNSNATTLEECELTGNTYTAVDFVVVGVTGGYYDHHNPRLFDTTTVRLVRRINLICAMILEHGIISQRSNETVVVTGNHSLSIYARTLSRYSYRQEYLSPEQLDLDCVTPGGKGHLDECRLMHGIWSSQQTIYAKEEATYTHTCGPNELFVGQTVDVLTVNQTCDDDGFGCNPHLPMCKYSIFNSSAETCLSFDGATDVAACEAADLSGDAIASAGACSAAGACVYSSGEFVEMEVECHMLCEVPMFDVPAVTESCIFTGDPEDLNGPNDCLAVDLSGDEDASRSECAAVADGGCTYTPSRDEFNATGPVNYILCNGTNYTSPWALENHERHWPGNDYDWRSKQHYGGAATNQYHATFTEDSLHVQGEAVNLPRDFIESRAEYQRPFGYMSPERLHANDGAYGNEYWSWQGEPAPQTGRRHLQAQEQRNKAFDSFVTASPAMAVRVSRRLQEQAVSTHRRALQIGGAVPGGGGGDALPGIGAADALPEGQIMVGANCSAPACAGGPTLDDCTDAEKRAITACEAVDISVPTAAADCEAAEYAGFGANVPAGCVYFAGVATNVTVIEYNPLEHKYVKEVGGICEKISFAANTSHPGQPVLVRYEDDRHFPVDKVVGAGSQDNAPSSMGCSGVNCPTGDKTDPVHHKERCPAGTVVTGVVTQSGDWLDSMQYVCTPIQLVSYKTVRIRVTDAAQLEAEQAAADLGNLASLLG